jgi:hypothetical protein
MSLLDQNGVPAVPSVTVIVNAASAIVEHGLPIIDETLDGGSYTLAVRASDAKGQTNAYTSLQVSPAPLRLRAAFVVERALSATTVVKIDSTLNASTFFSWPHQLLAPVISSIDSRIILAGTLTGPLVALSADNAQPAWELPNLNTTGSPYFTALTFAEDGLCYHATSTGQVRGHTAGSGQSAFTAQCLSGHLGYSLHVQDDLVVAAQIPLAGTNARLVTYARSSGAPQQQYPLDKTVIAMTTRAVGQMLLFGQRNAEAVVEDRELDTGGWWEPRTYPGRTLVDVASQDGNTHYLAFTDGIERFTYNNAGSVALGSLSDTRSLAWDKAQGLLWAGRNGQVSVLDPLSGQVLQDIPVGVQVDHLLLLFNR